MAPVETMRDESSLKIIENEVEAKRRKKEQEGIKCGESCPIIIAIT